MTATQDVFNGALVTLHMGHHIRVSVEESEGGNEGQISQLQEHNLVFDQDQRTMEIATYIL